MTLKNSKIISKFPQLTLAGRIFRLFGDGIYPMMTNLLRPFLAALPNSIEANFNEIMSSVRVDSEWNFGLITNTFQAVDFARWQRCFSTSPALCYRTATFLMNCIMCVRQTSMPAIYFNCPLPSIQEYLAGYF